MKILDRFLRHDYVCPGPFRSPHPRLRGDRYEYPFLTFLRYLAEIGVVSVETITPEPETDLLLRPFEEWLRHHRGIGGCGKACKDDPLGGKSASSLTHLVWLQKLLFVVQRWKGKRG